MPYSADSYDAVVEFFETPVEGKKTVGSPCIALKHVKGSQMVPPKPVVKAVEPEETQTGLTRAQIKAELPTVVLEISEETPKKPEPVGKDETKREVFAPTIHEYVYAGKRPAAPAGVPQNIWDMVFEANNSTDSRQDTSRADWKRIADRYQAEYVAKQIAA